MMMSPLLILVGSKLKSLPEGFLNAPPKTSTAGSVDGNCVPLQNSGGGRSSVNGSVPAIRQLPLDTCSDGRDSGDGMARKLRIQYPGAVYHVMNRGDRRESIFHDNDDRQRFIET